MGKDWLWCAAGGGGSGGGRREAGSTSGCLNIVFQIFNFHRQVPSNFNSSPTSFHPVDQPPVPKGIEAPRNSLEIDEPNFRQAAPLSSVMKMEDNLHISMGIQIKTRVNTVRSTTADYSSSPDYLNSPSAKTPTLVARLMGLDLLPDSSSPSPSLSSRSFSKIPQKSHRKDKILTGIRSLPETPRVSSARKSDVDRRLSLQSNRESVGEIELSGRPRIKIIKRESREEDEVRERVKQIKEGVSRKFGVEITNRVKNRGNESEIVLLKANKPKTIEEEFGESRYSMKLLEKEKHNQRILNRNLKKNVITNKQNEPFVRSNLGKIRKGDLVNEKGRKRKMPSLKVFAKINRVSGPLLPVKKEPAFRLATKLPPKQKHPQVSTSLSSKSITQLSSTSSRKYRQAPEDKSTVQCTTSDRSNGRAPITCAGQEFFQYIQDVLLLKGICINSPTPITEFSSMSLSIDPVIFNQLELSHSHFSLVCDRKLVFELVHEILGEIFRPLIEFRPLNFPELKEFEICGSELIEKLCKKIKSFPLADCQNLEDIDALVDEDLGQTELRRLVVFEEESEAIVEEIGLELFDMIMQEVTMDML